MTGTLYLCATPIGNLEDITFRVLRTLKEVDLIAAEDTRNSIKLLNHFEIKTPMTSYHEFNKIDKAYQLVAKLKEGKNIALITMQEHPAFLTRVRTSCASATRRACLLPRFPGQQRALQRSPCRAGRPGGLCLRHFCRGIKRNARASLRSLKTRLVQSSSTRHPIIL